MAEEDKELADSREELLKEQRRAARELKNYVSSVAALDEEVKKQEKAVAAARRRQHELSQTHSMINNMFSKSKGEILKSIVNAKQENERVAQKIKINGEELLLAQKRKSAYESELAKFKQTSQQEQSALSKATEVRKRFTGWLEKAIASETQLNDARNTEIAARKNIAAQLGTSVDKTKSDLADLNTSISGLGKQSTDLQKEQDKHLSILGDLNKRAVAGEKLTDAENAQREQLSSRIDEITDTLKNNARTLDQERLKRTDLVGQLNDQESELTKLNTTIASMEAESEQSTQKLNTLKSRLDEVNEEMEDLAKKTKEITGKEEAFGKAIDGQTAAINQKTKESRLLNFQKLVTKMSGFADILGKVAEPFDKLVTKTRELQQQFGVSAGTAAKIGLSNLKESVDSFASALLPGGKSGPGVTVEQIAQAQEDFQEEFGGLITSEAGREMAQEAVKMGVTTKQLAQARRVFLTQTMGDAGKAQAQTDKFIGEFAKKGLSAKVAMQEIQKNSELLARNGGRFTESLARAAADAKKIGFELSKVSQFGDNLINDFEGFLESQAELGAMGFGFDSSRLAEIAETGSDADLFNELRSQLAATGKDITKLRRSERVALESAFGINISDMMKLAGETPEGGGEDTVDPSELQKEANKSLGDVVNFTEASVAALGVISGTLLYANGLLSTIAANTGIGAAANAAGGLASRAGGALRGGLTAVGSSIPVGGGLTMGSTLSAAAGAGAAGAAAIGGTVVAGLGAGLAIGNQFNTSVKEGGSGTLGDWWNFGFGKSKEEKEADRKNDEWAQARGFKSMADYLASKKKTRGDDVVSQPGYGKRSLVTPSGVIALNNKDNIIAYADDLVGAKKLPFGSIAKSATGGMFGIIDQFKAKIDEVFSGIIAPAGPLGKVSQFMKTDLGAAAGKKVGGLKEGLVGKGMEFASKIPGLGNLMGKGGIQGAAMDFASKIPGLGGLLGKGGAQGVVSGFASKIPGLGSLLGGNTAGAATEIASKIPGLGGLLGKGGLQEKALGFASKIPGVGGLLGGGLAGKAMGFASKIPGLGALTSKIPGLGALTGLKEGGVGGALSSLASAGAGRLIGGALGTLIPIPGVGTALGSLAGGFIGKGVGKAISGVGRLFGGKKKDGAVSSVMGLAKKITGSKIGSSLMSKASPLARKALGIAGMFGKKTEDAVNVSPEMMSAPQTDLSMMVKSQATEGQKATVEQKPAQVDTSGIEKQLSNFINALQNIEINMDGAKVGKVLVNTADAAMSTGVFRVQAR